MKHIISMVMVGILVSMLIAIVPGVGQLYLLGLFGTGAYIIYMYLTRKARAAKKRIQDLSAKTQAQIKQTKKEGYAKWNTSKQKITAKSKELSTSAKDGRSLLQTKGRDLSTKLTGYWKER